MNNKLWLALLPVAALCWTASSVSAQSSPLATCTAVEVPRVDADADTGRMIGIVLDPTGAVVEGAKIQLKPSDAGESKTCMTGPGGRFIFTDLAPGIYQAIIDVRGFERVILREFAVAAGKDSAATITLKIRSFVTDVVVKGTENDIASTSRRTVGMGEQSGVRNAAELVAEASGVSLRQSGALAAVPALHGLGDERAKVVVDGATLTSACANHMNPPLSFIAPSQTAVITVMAGITPVSLGGDSLGGTIVVDSELPVFAKAGEKLHAVGSSSGFYRSNWQSYGGSLTGWLSGSHLALGYSGSWSTNGDYTDGSGHKITSTYAQSTDHTLTLAARTTKNLLVLQAGVHHVPFEGFANAQMDLVRNYAESLNLHYRRTLERGTLDARAYWQNNWHSMNIGGDKSTFPMPMWMPMNTHGRDAGYSVALDLSLSARHTLRAGNELHRFRLDDVWPAVAGTAPRMGPNAFISINNGRRTRLGTYVEVASKWNAQWTTLLGLRNDTVWTEAGQVSGYSSMYSMDATAFNAANRAHADAEIDATVLARWTPKAKGTYEFGYARKNRAPNLYERYAWSKSWMSSGMIGWFGDGNYYVGSVALMPETSHTVSGSASWRAGGTTAWEFKISPYLTYIQNYVDVNTLATRTYGLSTFAQLQFVNSSARIYGADVAASATLWKSDHFGQGSIGGVAAWLHGERLDTHTPLYQMMPLNVRVHLEEEWKGLTVGVGMEAVDRKSHVDPRRFEQNTPGYTLLNLHAEYKRGFLRMSVAADNVLNREYEQPLGGVNYDDFLASGKTSHIKPLTGAGRSAFFSVSARF